MFNVFYVVDIKKIQCIFFLFAFLHQFSLFNGKLILMVLHTKSWVLHSKSWVLHTKSWVLHA